MAQTTIMRDSMVGDDWIRQMVALNPITRVMKDGKPTGVITFFARLSFTDFIFEKGIVKNSQNANAKPKYRVTPMLPPITDITVLYEERWRILAETFPEYYNAEANNPVDMCFPGLHFPWHDGKAKAARFSGYTNGSMFAEVASDFAPQVVVPGPDGTMPPLLDRSKVYAGVWAIVASNAYAYGKTPPQPRKGCGFGLLSLCIVGDDQPLAGGQMDPQQAFGASRIVPPLVVPGAGFGQQAVQQAAVPPNNMAALGYGPQGGAQGVPSAPPMHPTTAPAFPAPGPALPPASYLTDDEAELRRMIGG